MSVYIREPQKSAQACVIWLHGLGADASDMMGLADQLMLDDVALRHVFIDAPKRPVTMNGGMVMPAWYDIIGLDLTHRVDKEGIEQSELIIRKVLEQQIKEGFDPGQIILAGFSQGGIMAIHTALNTPSRLAGVIALSACIPLANQTQPILDKTTPFFMGAGQFDPLILPKWTEESKEWLLTMNYEHISYHQYPMEHSICFEEIKDMGIWLIRQLQGVLQ